MLFFYQTNIFKLNSIKMSLKFGKKNLENSFHLRLQLLSKFIKISTYLRCTKINSCIELTVVCSSAGRIQAIECWFSRQVGFPQLKDWLNTLFLPTNSVRLILLLIKSSKNLKRTAEGMCPKNLDFNDRSLSTSKRFRYKQWILCLKSQFYITYRYVFRSYFYV